MNEEKKPQKKKQILFKREHIQNHPHAKWLNTAIRSNRWGKERKVKVTYKKLNGEMVEREVKPLGTRGDHLIAHDYHREGVRSFHIGRIEKMEKSAFFCGFEKASEKRKGPSKGEILGRTAAIGVGGSMLGVGGAALGTPHSKAKDLLKVYHQAKKDIGSGEMPQVRFKGPTADFSKVRSHGIGGSQYDPITHRVHAKPNIGILAHELGHGTGKMIPGQVASRLLHLPTSMISPLVAGSSDNETARNIALAAPLAVATPTLLEEGRASYKGLRTIKRALGWRAAAKSAPGLAAAFGSYAALPITATAVGYWAKKKKEESKK